MCDGDAIREVNSFEYTPNSHTSRSIVYCIYKGHFVFRMPILQRAWCRSRKRYFFSVYNKAFTPYIYITIIVNPQSLL